MLNSEATGMDKDSKFRGTTNAFSIGNTYVLTLPKKIAEELEINDLKKTYFNIYTIYKKGEKTVIYEFTKHSDK